MRLLFFVWLCLGAWGLTRTAPAQPHGSPAQEAQWACEEAEAARGVPRERAPCVCRARLGLPETSVCKRLRGQRAAR